jgi:hypothetical protein
MGRYYRLVNTFFHEKKNEIFISREARKVFGNAEKEKKKEEGEMKSSTNIVWFINYPLKSSVIKHKNHPDSFKQY